MSPEKLKELNDSVDQALESMEHRVPTILSLKEVSAKTGLSYECLRQLCLKNEIVYFKSGTKYMVNYEKFLEFLNGNKPNA